MQRSICLSVGLLLAGCNAMTGTMRAPPAPVHSDNGAEDRDAVAAVLMGSTFQNMQRLTQAAPAEQAEILAGARTAFERSPQGSVQLRYALLLAVPGHPGRDPALAQTLLRQLAAQPETLVPVERAVALTELAQLDRELNLTAENDRLQLEAQRSDRERNATIQRRLQAEMDENVRLRKQVEDAQTKLDAIANIERNLTDRKNPGEGRQQ
jgi:hypothetical protein